MIAVGQRVPDATLYEFFETESGGCALGPNAFSVAELVKGKKIVVFGLPGAFTPTCSAKHVPGFVQAHDQLRAAGVDEVWCHAVNDAFVMGAWGKAQNADEIIMLADGNGEMTAALGLELDGSGFGLGTRSQRFAMIVEDGKVTHLNIEEGPGVDVSSAETMMALL